MDTSETYIKMCDCPEIQEGHGELTWIQEDFCGWKNKKLLWLPRQDQIQEMLGYAIGALVNDFHQYCELDLKMYENPSNLPRIMEQLWLAFYMHEKHKKIWDGEKWAIK